MKEVDIKEIIDFNYKVLTLLGYATALLHDSLADKTKVSWFFEAIDNVIYKKTNLPPMPE